MKKVLLLNPPGSKKYFRDYYCPCVSKAKYYYHPLDLVYLSGTLNKDFQVSVIDAIAQNLSIQTTQQKIKDINPDYVIFLVSSPSYEEDSQFFTDLKKRLPTTEFIGTGDVYREYKEKSFKLHDFLDTILLDFSTPDILTYLTNKTNGKVIDNIIYKQGKKIINGGEKHGNGVYHVPIPRWDLFPLKAYQFPFSRRGTYATIITDFGCPFHCLFCPMGTMGFKLRDLDTVIAEIKLLKSLGVNELFIRDQTFGVNKKRSFELCQRIIDEKLDISWTCFSRVDVMTKELLQMIKRAGCHTVMYGVESGSDKILKQYNKLTNIKQITKAIKLTKTMGLRTVGTFIIGLPGETKHTIHKTILFAQKLKLDFASFNIATPRFSTHLRNDLLAKGLIDQKQINQEQQQINELSEKEIFSLEKMAIKSFYLRPNYIIHRLLAIRTWYEAREQIKEGWSLLFG